MVKVGWPCWLVSSITYASVTLFPTHILAGSELGGGLRGHSMSRKIIFSQMVAVKHLTLLVTELEYEQTLCIRLLSTSALYKTESVQLLY